MTQNRTVRFETLGCKLNQIESESAARAFFDGGFDCRMDGVSAASRIDTHTVLCIVNTCTVTAKAEQKCRRIIRLLLEKYPRAAVLITGCYAQLDGSFLCGIDKRIAVLGGKHKDVLVRLPDFLHFFTKDGTDLAAELRALYAGSFDTEQSAPPQTYQKYGGHTHHVPAPFAFAPNRHFVLSTDTFLQHSRPSLKIQDGCDNRCSYCRICFARGPSVSLRADTVLERVLQLEKAGHCEAVLTGVNLSQYSFCPSDKAPAAGGLAQLLTYLLAHTERISLRLSSLHPQIVTDELCTVLAHERIRPHFHLSVQSGSDTILQAMKRPYNAARVKEAVEHLHRIKKLPFIACDIITGFPGETPEDFSETLQLCRICAFSWIHAFPFSPRPGTQAYAMRPVIPPATAKHRVRELTVLAAAQKKAYIESCIGSDFKAVIEKFRKNEVRAVTENFLHVRVKHAEDTLLHMGGREMLLRIDALCTKTSHTDPCDAFAVRAEHR